MKPRLVRIIATVQIVRCVRVRARTEKAAIRKAWSQTRREIRRDLRYARPELHIEVLPESWSRKTLKGTFHA